MTKTKLETINNKKYKTRIKKDMLIIKIMAEINKIENWKNSREKINTYMWNLENGTDEVTYKAEVT